MAGICGTVPHQSPVTGTGTFAIDPVRQPTETVQISDDEDLIELARIPDTFNRTAPHREIRAGSALTMDTTGPALNASPMNKHEHKRPKLNDTNEASKSRGHYPRARIEFIDADDGFTQFHPAFFDDAFLCDESDDASTSSADTAAKYLEKEAIRQARRPPYYEDAKFKIRMFCGPGYQYFPLPLSYDPKFQEACDRFDAGGEQIVAEDVLTVLQQDCLLRVLDVFPDVEHKFVLDRIKSQTERIRFPDGDIEMQPNSAPIVNEILEMEVYPRQPASTDKPPDEFEGQLGKPIIWTRDHREDPEYKNHAIALLALHFDHVPTHFITSIVRQKGNLFDAFVVIDDAESDYFQRSQPYQRSTRPRTHLEPKYQTLNPAGDPQYYCKLVVELQAAKQHVRRKRLQTDRKQQIADAEVANLEQRRLDGLLVQCKCCFDEEVPMNRSVVCHADEEHPFCYDCVKNMAETQIGMRRHEMQCMDESGCKEPLELEGIGKAVPIKTFDRLQFNQQQAEIKAADIDGLEQCPLCDFQAICDPPDVDPVFSCQNPDCFKVTCRMCHEISHLPRTCEEVKKDRGLSARHKIEEARTRAMIRTCPSCQSAIIKSDGCNKMRCTCGTVICYACKLDLSKLKDPYNHFSSSRSKAPCPLYDNTKMDRHAQEANEAEEKAILEAKAEDNTIEEDTLRIDTAKGKGTDRSRKQNETTKGRPRRRLGDPMDHRVARLAQGIQNVPVFQDVNHNFPAAQVPVVIGPEPAQGRRIIAPVRPRRRNEQTVQPNLFPEPNRTLPCQPPPAFGFGIRPGHDNRAWPRATTNVIAQPQMNDPHLMDFVLQDPAERVNNFQHQQKRHQYPNIERRNTFHDQTLPQTFNAGAFGTQVNNNELQLSRQNSSFTFGTRPPVANAFEIRNTNSNINPNGRAATGGLADSIWAPNSVNNQLGNRNQNQLPLQSQPQNNLPRISGSPFSTPRGVQALATANNSQRNECIRSWQAQLPHSATQNQGIFGDVNTNMNWSRNSGINDNTIAGQMNRGRPERRQTLPPGNGNFNFHWNQGQY